MSALRDTVEEFLSALVEIAEEHEELCDTDVREGLAEVLHYYFVWGHEVDRVPVTFRMFTAEGDAAVIEAVEDFLDSAPDLAEREDIPLGQRRLDVLQDETLELPEGETYDLYIGHADEPLPDEPPSSDLYEEREYDDYDDDVLGDDDEDDDDDTDDEDVEFFDDEDDD